MSVRSAVVVEERVGFGAPVRQGELLSCGADVLVGELFDDVVVGLTVRRVLPLACLPPVEEPVVDVTHGRAIGVSARFLKRGDV